MFVTIRILLVLHKSKYIYIYTKQLLWPYSSPVLSPFFSDTICNVPQNLHVIFLFLFLNYSSYWVL
jgi:hypothetical protein